MKQIVILVHGTFATDAPWTQDESVLAKEVRSVDPTQISIKRFNWTGRNSFSDRLSASEKLLQLMVDLSLVPAPPAIHIIAHSHGGNIAVMATARAPSSVNLQSITTLGTPYLSLSLKTWTTAGGLSSFAALLAAMLVASTVSNLISSGAPQYIAGVLLLAFWLACYLGLKRSYNRAKLVVDQYSFMRTQRISGVRFLCIRHRLDEANFWLFTLSIFRYAERALNAIYQFITGPGAVKRVVLLFLSGFAVSTVFQMIGGLFPLPIIDLLLGTLLFTAIFLPILSALGTLSTSHKFRLAGRPSIYSLFIDVVLSPMPRLPARYESFSGSYFLGSFRLKLAGRRGFATPHSMGYLDPAAIQRIKEFISSSR